MAARLLHSLKHFNTFGLDHYCSSLHEVQSKVELIERCTQLYQNLKPMLVIGGGSNILLAEDFEGTVIRVATKGVKIQQDSEYYYIEVEAGENWHTLVCYCLDRGIAGLENLALIPGTVGAAPIQNIGAYGLEFKSVCNWVEYIDLASGKLIRLSAEGCEYGYRQSIFKGVLRGHSVITCVGIKLAKQWIPCLSYATLASFAPETVKPRQIFEYVCEVRGSKLPDPEVLGNGGSFFKNPVIPRRLFMDLQRRYPEIVGYQQDSGLVKVAAGWLIDHAGLKGFGHGKAAVHQQQALVLVNRGGAIGEDLVELARSIIDQIEQLFGITLEVEIRIIGAHGEKSLRNC